MLFGVTVVVVVPAFDEAPRIARMLARVPDGVDRVIVVDDASRDATAAIARSFGDARVHVVSHATNRGVGAAIATGYRVALERTTGARDAFVVMAGDDQMHPDDLPALVAPIARGEAGYVKGDRFADANVARVMPRARLWGGRALSWATSRAVGRPISDSQCGYTAISRAACARLDLDGLWPRYGYPNDLIGQLAVRGIPIAEAPVRAVYADEVSRLKPRHVPTIAALVARAWVRRVIADAKGPARPSS